MKLNLQNYEVNYEKVITSRLNSKMRNTNAVVLVYSGNELLATKIYTVLKREYSVSLIQALDMLPAFQVVHFWNVDMLRAYFNLNQIDTVIFTSELIVDLAEKYGMEKTYEYIYSVEKLSEELEVKIVYIGIDYLLYGWSEIDKIKSNMANIAPAEQYSEIDEKILLQPRNLIIETSAIYGKHEYMESQDFISYVENIISRDIECSFDDNIEIQPFLVDEIAQTVSEYIDKQGKYRICDNECRTTLYQWAKMIIEQKRDCGNAEKIFPVGTSKMYQVKTCDTEFINKRLMGIQEGYHTAERQKKCLFHLIYKMSPLDFFYGYRVADVRAKLGAALAKTLAKETIDTIDCVVPVPNTGLYYAMGLAQAINKPLVLAMTKNSEKIRSFQLLDNNVRKQIIKNKVLVLDELLVEKKIILVDEAIFTGTTLKIVCKRLRECKLQQLHIAIPTPQCPNQCEYYVQPRRSMLLEYVREKMLPDYFDADSVTFQNMPGFLSVVDEIGKDFCLSCFGGDEI